jgi:hypothetical protein
MDAILFLCRVLITSILNGYHPVKKFFRANGIIHFIKFGGGAADNPVRECG